MSNASFDASTTIPQLAVAVDVVLFTVREDTLQLVLVKRKAPPFRGMWALPGGFVRDNESLEEAALRELAEETNVRDVYLEQLYTFGQVVRDPRMRVISVVYYALINSDVQDLKSGHDAEDATWFSVYDRPELAFDHASIVEYALRRLRYKLEYAPVAFQLLPKRFTLTELQRVYEFILSRELDKRNFRRKILSLGFLRKTEERKRDGAHRPAQLYEFVEEKFDEATGGGVMFSF